MHNQDYLKALKLFNEKTETLKKSNFTKTLLKKGIGGKFSWKKDENSILEIWRPDADEIRAFVLTFRFFIQNNEKSSFRNMAKIYDELPISAEKKESFKNTRKKLNDFLDSKSRIGIDDSTNRDIVWTFIYGDLSHADETKKEIYDRWMSIAIANELITNEFALILWEVLKVIAFIQNLNNEVMEELGENK